MRNEAFSRTIRTYEGCFAHHPKTQPVENGTMEPLSCLATPSVSFLEAEDAPKLCHVFAPDCNALISSMCSLVKKNIPMFPGPNPCSMDRADIDGYLKKKPYFLTRKTDGVRVLLFITRLRDMNIACFVNRKLTVALAGIIQHIPTAMFQGSIIDGELVMNQTSGKLTFLAFDGYAVSGVSLLQSPHSRRLAALHAAFRHYKTSPEDTCVLAIKKFYRFPSEYQALVAAASNEEFRTDGYIFQPDEPPKFGRCASLLKLKPEGHHTVDFVCLDEAGQLGVYDPKARKNVAVAMLADPPPNCAVSKILECSPVHVSHGEMRWRCVKLRDDKNQANDRQTYVATLRNIDEKLTLEEIVQHF